MANKYVWVCDYCKKEFKTDKECKTHEKDCYLRSFKNNKSILTIGFIIVLTFFLGNILAKESGNIFELVNPKPTATPIPTLDPDPLISCSWGEGAEKGKLCSDKMMRKSECEDSVCCGLGNGTNSPMSKVDCAKLQAELNSRKPVYVQQPIRIQRPINCTTNTIGNYTYTNCF